MTVILYPTKYIKRTVAELYAYIMKFLMRAREWFMEGWVKHAWHSVSRPVALRYTDLLEEIRVRSEVIERFALLGAYAEQREMHNKLEAERVQLRSIHTEMQHMKEIMLCMYHLIRGRQFSELNDVSISEPGFRGFPRHKPEAHRYTIIPVAPVSQPDTTP